MSLVFTRALTVLMWAGLASSQLAAQPGRLTGVVVDLRTGVPLPDVRVVVDGQQPGVVTDAQGAFALAVSSGSHTIEASLVGFAVARETVTIAADSVSLVIRLAEGTGAFEERITVTAAPPQSEAPGSATLFGRDLQNLGMLLDDPLRAVHPLPAVTSTDDFYAEFSVRGSSFDRIGVTLDGIPTKYLIHTIEEATDAGSVAMINSETLGSVSLLPGSYPQRTGRHLGGQLDLVVRDGSRERQAFRAGLSGTSATFLGEGPIRTGRGSWLLSARQSYLDLLVKRIDPSATFVFRFADAQSKLTYDVSPRHRVELLAITGRTSFNDDPSAPGPNEESWARKTGWLGGASWRWLPHASFTMTQKLYATGASFANENATGALLDDGVRSDLGWRADAIAAIHTAAVVQLGADVVRRSEDSTMSRTLDGQALPTITRERDETALASGTYVQVRASPAAFLTITPGVRVDHWSATNERAASPWLIGEVRLSTTTRLVAATGLYTQFPDLSQMPTSGEGDPHRERARHVDLSITQSLPAGASLHVSAYRRIESDVLWQHGAEPRQAADGSIVLGRGDARWINALDGRSEGVELLVRRDSPVGAAGWIGYAFGRSRYTDPATGESYWSDFDQRHSFSAYAVYRLSSRGSVSAKFRYGSNYPLRGYVDRSAPAGPGLFGGDGLRFYTLGTSRNTLRLPAYSRLDIRGDRVFSIAGRRMTAFVEVINLLNRTNVRNVPFGADRSGRIFDPTETLMPLMPSAGFTFEF